MPEQIDILNAASTFSRAVQRTLFEARQKTFGESIVADVYDDILDIFPVVGEIIGEGPRILDAAAKKDDVAIIAHTVDAAIGEIPGIGFIIDLFLPVNTILRYSDYATCAQTNNTEECLFPPGTVERDILNYGRT